MAVLCIQEPWLIQWTWSKQAISAGASLWQKWGQGQRSPELGPKWDYLKRWAVDLISSWKARGANAGQRYLRAALVSGYQLTLLPSGKISMAVGACLHALLPAWGNCLGTREGREESQEETDESIQVKQSFKPRLFKRGLGASGKGSMTWRR